MNRLSFVAAAALGILTSLPAAAQPRSRVRHQASEPTPAPQAQADDDDRASSNDDDLDGPEAKAVATFKLDDLIKVMVRQSPTIVRARLERETAHGGAGASRKEQAWVFSAQAQYERDAIGAGTPVEQLEPLQVLSQDRYSGGVSLGRKLPTGGTITAEVDASHSTKELNVPLQLLAQQNAATNSGLPDIFYENQATAKLTFKQPLLRGFGPDVTLAPQHKADLAFAEATLKAQLAAEDTIKDLEIGYWELAYANFAVDVAAQALEFVKKQDELTRQEMRAGTAPATSGNAITYQMAIRDEALISAKLELEKKSMELRRIAGLEIGRRDIVMKPVDPFEVGDEEFTVDGALTRSHKANRKLAALTIEKKMADIDVDVAQNGRLPEVDVTLSGALTGTGDTGSAAFNGISSGDGYQVMAGLSISLELTGAAKHAHAGARAKRRILDVQKADLERQIDAEVVAATKAVIAGRTRVALADKAIAMAEENLRAERANFLAQRTNNFGVMARQGDLVDAQLKRGRAIAEYHEAVTQLRYLSGTLLEQYHLDVNPHDDDEGK